MQFRDAPDLNRRLQDSWKSDLVLLVEDDFVLRSSLSELLALEGFRVECCADGGDAFRRLHHPPKPAVILLDIMLPHIDGFEFRAMQRKVPGFASTPSSSSRHATWIGGASTSWTCPCRSAPLDIDQAAGDAARPPRPSA